MPTVTAGTVNQGVVVGARDGSCFERTSAALASAATAISRSSP
jgi:hypothetical protein